MLNNPQQRSSARPPRAPRLPLLGSCILLIGLCCCTHKAGEELDTSELILHLDYRSGGDAPLGFLMSFFEDGRVRFLSPRHKERWSRLSTDETKDLQALLRSADFQQGVEIQAREGPRFACCDAEEVGIFLSAVAEPVSVTFTASSAAPQPLYELIRMVNRIGRANFGRRYSLPLPERATDLLAAKSPVGPPGTGARLFTEAMRSFFLRMPTHSLLSRGLHMQSKPGAKARVLRRP